ncbi:MAG: HEAT repeat domain-containing protein [Ruminococcaceae bacterium]|nr:HEAT repeat domain-containing protein [Oscillospiraceae bacterium]
MKKLLSVILMVTLVLSLAACGGEKGEKGEQTKDFETLKAEYQTKTPEELLSEHVKDTAKATDEEIAALVKTAVYGEINENYVFESNITDEALGLLQEEGVDGAYATDYAKNLLDDEDKMVRAYVYDSFSTYIPLDDEEIENYLLEKVKAETDPTVIACILRGLSNALSERPEFADYAVTYTQNEDPVLRYWAVYALGFYRLDDNEKYVDAMIPLLKDSDADVAELACGEIGGFGSEKAVEPLAAVLADETLVDIHSAATDSLEELWMNFPFYDGTSEAAYRAHMAYLNSDSENPEIPSWLSVSSIKNPGGGYEDWKEQSTYFSVDELITTLTKIVSDKGVDSLTRTTAIQGIGAFGTAENLEALKAIVAGDEEESYLMTTIESELEEKNQ